eukprot:jgi/Undpi1/7349/HiC_scaffold_22.g09822.m1
MSAPMDGLSLSEEACLSQLRQPLQRDINCLSDPDRSTRRRALTKLQRALFQEAKIPEAVLRGFFSRFLSEKLVGILADPVEKCREMGAGLLMEFVSVSKDVPADTAALARQVFSMVETRVGAVPLIEPTEEVRALLLRLCCAVLGKDSAETFGIEIAGEACGVLSAALTDPFPETKRECCSLLVRLAFVCPEGLRSRLGKVLRPLILNLGHQHSKTRQMTLQALGALLLCGSDDLDKVLRELVLPQFRNLLYDRTVAVRSQLATVLASLIDAGLPRDPPTTPAVVAMEEADNDSGAGGNIEPKLESGGAVVGGGGDGGGGGGSGGGGAVVGGGGDGGGGGGSGGGGGGGGKMTLYLEPFRAELVSLLMNLLADDSPVVCEEAGRLLEELGERWGRFNVAEVDAMREGDGSPPPPPPPPPSERAGATKETRKSDTASSPSTKTPASTLTSVPPAAARALCVSLLHRVMPMVIEDASHWTVRGRRRAVWLLCSLVRDDEPEVRRAVAECAAAIGRAVCDISAVTDVLLPVLKGELLRVLLWLLAGCDAFGGEEAKEEVLEVAALLAGESAGQGAQELFAEHFSQLLSSVVGVAAGGEGGALAATPCSGEALDGGWDKGSHRRAGFEALLRSAPRAVGQHLDEVMPIFRGLLHDASREPELRLSMLALLECVMKQEEVTEAGLRPHAGQLLTEMVLPNAVWRAGMVAATVRKVAVAVLYTALRGNKIGVEAVYATAEQLLPVLKTNLEDHEATTRRMACLSLEMLFEMIPGALGEEPVRLIYPELLKRLDDSNDAVRRAVCGTMKAFFRATAPQNVRGTVLQYSSEQLLVHLDDQDEEVQLAVFQVLEVAASIDPEGTGKLALAARSSHRTPEYCDRLMALANP